MDINASTAAEDPAWDEFLVSSTLGEFSQSAPWARCKKTSGWNRLRTAVRRDGRIEGGFQLLWKATRFGRIGYVSKGPVARGEEPRLVDELVTQLADAARRIRLAALVVHPPGRSRLTPTRLRAPVFLPNRVLEIITATLVVDVSDGMAAVEARMRRTTRKLLRRAVRGGLRVREGSAGDLDLFFGLMRRTCERQGVAPNPSSAAALMSLWQASGGAARCRLTLAEHDGKAIGGLFCIGFGEVLTLWKKGTLPECLPLRPMELLYHEAFAWAHANGYRLCDLGSLNRRAAERLIAGRPLSEEQKRSRDVFNLGFGGAPVLLPEAGLHFPNPALSLGYRLLTANRLALKWLKRSARRIEAG